ncbi:RING-type E3 ubiquitin transferase [Salvia divinorum]|uniref:RING-type E3 ubiquitin transferase n=1 Tax=Salvia divinorum TaxID=28513 RepID=A0ABD1FP69_SALDI
MGGIDNVIGSGKRQETQACSGGEVLPPATRTKQAEGRLIPQGVDPRNYFTGPGLEGLIEEITQNDRPGLPPAPDSAIHAIPTIKIAQAHLETDTECPVCKEELKVGLHNSCPVRRHELEIPNQIGEDESSQLHVEDRRCPELRCLAGMWPFRSRYRPLRPSGDGARQHHAAESWRCNISKQTRWMIFTMVLVFKTMKHYGRHRNSTRNL